VLSQCRSLGGTPRHLHPNCCRLQECWEFLVTRITKANAVSMFLTCHVYNGPKSTRRSNPARENGRELSMTGKACGEFAVVASNSQIL
jgi:hypothetical protein